MAIVDVKEIIEAGVHFGHRASRWHPKMQPFIFGKRNLIHIVDVRETIRGLVRASNFLVQLMSSGKDALFVGTKRQAKALILNEAQRTGMHWVSERWLGGSLTNFHTIRQRLKRLEELESMESDGSIEEYSKKRISTLRRERRKILRNLEGLRNMKQLPGCLIIVDIRREHIAVREARKVGIPVVALVDTDCDPREADIVIPGNDDAYRSIQVVLRVLADAVILGRKKFETSQAEIARAQAQEASQQKKELKAKAVVEAPAAPQPQPQPQEPPQAAPGSAAGEVKKNQASAVSTTEDSAAKGGGAAGGPESGAAEGSP